MSVLSKIPETAILIGVVLVFSTLATSASVQHHPFSEVFPPNIDLDFGGKDIENVSDLETATITPNQTDITFRDTGNVETLRWDNSEREWKLNGVNLNINGNNITEPDDIKTGGQNIQVRDTTNGQDIARFNEGGNLEIPNGNLSVSGTTDTVDLDNPGNSITLSGNQYLISSGAIDSNEMASNSLTNSELSNSDTFNFASFQDSGDTSYFLDPAATGQSLKVAGDAEVQGNLDVWGEIQNTQITTLNVNGSIVPPSGYDSAFNIGNSTRRWKQGHFNGNINLSGNSITGAQNVKAGSEMCMGQYC